MIVSLPIAFPKLEPDDWEKWWSIWNENVSPVKKVLTSPNNVVAPHMGFDVYTVDGFNPTYTAKYVNLKTLYPSLLKQITDLPFKINGARFLTSTDSFPAHCDNGYVSWPLRSMFYCEDPEPQWYYESIKGTCEKKTKHWLTLPTTTNWWSYKDREVKHGTVYRPEYPKIILQIFADTNLVNRFVEYNIGKFPEYEIDL